MGSNELNNQLHPAEQDKLQDRPDIPTVEISVGYEHTRFKNQVVLCNYFSQIGVM